MSTSPLLIAATIGFASLLSVAAAKADTAVPPHACPVPEVPAANAAEGEVAKGKKKLDDFQVCLKKYLDERQATIKSHQDSANAAVKQYNDMVKTFNDRHSAKKDDEDKKGMKR